MAEQQFNHSDGVSLKEHFDDKFDMQCKKFNNQIASLSNAVDKSERLLQVRLEGLNEWRDQNKDIISKFVTKTEINLQVKRLEDKLVTLGEDIKKLELSKAELQGKASQTTALIAMVGGLLGIVLSVIALFGG